MAHQAKPFMPGKSSSPSYGGGLKKPSYTGAPRPNTKSYSGNQAAPYRSGSGQASGGGGAKASGKGVPGQGPMASGSAAGTNSYPTKNSGVRHASGHKNTLQGSKLR